MKKKLSAIIVSLFAVAVLAPGASAHNVGCGLGDQIFLGADSILLQVFAVTTNGSTANQTFGITSGTLGCQGTTGFVNLENINLFVASNMDNLAKDMAQGKGESLDTLAELMEIPSENRGMFNTAMQSNFSKIFTNEDVKSGEVVDKIASIALDHHLI